MDNLRDVVDVEAREEVCVPEEQLLDQDACFRPAQVARNFPQSSQPVRNSTPMRKPGLLSTCTGCEEVGTGCELRGN